MTDDKTIRSGQDPSRINIEDPNAVRYWSEKFGVSEEELQGAVERVGPSPKPVAQELKLTHQID